MTKQISIDRFIELYQNAVEHMKQSEKDKDFQYWRCAAESYEFLLTTEFNGIKRDLGQCHRDIKFKA